MPSYQDIYGSSAGGQSEIYGEVGEDYYGVDERMTNVPDVQNMMYEYIGGTLDEETGQIAFPSYKGGFASRSLVDLLGRLIPDYRQTTDFAKEQAGRETMRKGIIQANIKQANALDQAKAKYVKEGESYGKMGFRSGESGISAKYINQALQNTSTSAAASAQKARYGFKIKSDKLREGYVESLWDLYGDFVGQDPAKGSWVED